MFVLALLSGRQLDIGAEFGGDSGLDPGNSAIGWVTCPVVGEVTSSASSGICDCRVDNLGGCGAEVLRLLPTPAVVPLSTFVPELCAGAGWYEGALLILILGRLSKAVLSSSMPVDRCEYCETCERTEPDRGRSPFPLLALAFPIELFLSRGGGDESGTVRWSLCILRVSS